MQQELPAQLPRVVRVQDVLIPVTLHDLGHHDHDAPRSGLVLQLLGEFRIGSWMARRAAGRMTSRGGGTPAAAAGPAVTLSPNVIAIHLTDLAGPQAACRISPCSCESQGLVGEPVPLLHGHEQDRRARVAERERGRLAFCSPVVRNSGGS